MEESIKTKKFNSNNTASGNQRRRKGNDNKRKGKGQPNKGEVSLNKKPANPPHRSNLPPVYVPRVQEPLPTCAICGKEIENIANALYGPNEGELSHFDCVIAKIAEEHKVIPPRKVSYIGRGTFAVLDIQADGKFEIVERIAYETPQALASMRQYVADNKK